MQDELWVPDLGDRSKFSQSIVWAVYFRRQGFVTGGRGMPHRKRITFWPLSLQWLEPISCTDGPSFLITSSLTGWSSLTKVKTISFQLPQLHGRKAWNEGSLKLLLASISSESLTALLWPFPCILLKSHFYFWSRQPGLCVKTMYIQTSSALGAVSASIQLRGSTTCRNPMCACASCRWV